MDRVIRVLIVDDSAFVRKVVRQMLSRSPALEVVGIARDGQDALELAEQLQPDVITLDLHMPRMDGLEFLRRQMARRPIPVVLLSSASESGELVIEALEAGAVDVVQKPTALASEQVLDVAEDLIAKVQSAAAAKVQVPIVPVQPSATVWSQTHQTEILVIGVSTGGPQALKQLIPLLPHNLPVPVAVVIHMPVGFTGMVAHHLKEISPLNVIEASDNLPIRPGMVLIAPAGYHLTFVRQADQSVRTSLLLRPLDTPHRPAVDVLFRSAADVFGEGVLAVVLTGMGADGTVGAGYIKAQGGRVLCEAESSCVVYGMPRSVVEAGLCDATIPLPRMAQEILKAL